MSKASTPIPSNYLKSSSSSGERFSSIASLSRRVYPLNLTQYKFNEIYPKRALSYIEVPEFASEYVKGPKVLRKKPEIKSSISHNRSVSYNYTPKSQPEVKQEIKFSTRIPHLSYKEFKASHRKSSQQNRMFRPQLIHLTKRANIILHSSKPISINPHIYHSRKSSELNHKTFSDNKTKKTTEEYFDASSVMAPGLTYGEKLLRLKALVVNTIG